MANALPLLNGLFTSVTFFSSSAEGQNQILQDFQSLFGSLYERRIITSTEVVQRSETSTDGKQTIWNPLSKRQNSDSQHSSHHENRFNSIEEMKPNRNSSISRRSDIELSS